MNSHNLTRSQMEKTMEKITLTKPFKLVDNREITELSLQFDGLSVADLG